MDEKDMAEARQLLVAAPVLYEVLGRYERNAYDKLLGEFRNSGEVKVATVAECSAYNSILEDINGRLRVLEERSK